MKVVDANVLIYAVNADTPRHAQAKAWIDAALRGPETIGFAWIAILAFLRLTTRAALFPRPLDPDQAFRIVESWLAQPAAVTLEPGLRHLSVLHGLIGPLGTAGNLVSDAHLAALAVEHRAEIVSFDADFSRFAGLRWHEPTS